MKGKQFSIGLVMLSLFLIAQVMIAGAQDSTPRIWPTSPVEQATAGQEFDVAINVGGADQVYGGSFQVTYDPQAFEVVLTDSKAVTPGAFFGDAPSFPLKNTAEAGTVDYALTLTQPAQPVSGDGVLGTITFRALKDAPVELVVGKASLVSPEFTEVDGRLIAQKINQVDAVIGETVVGDVAPAPVVQEVVSAPVAVVEQPPVVPVVEPTAEMATASVSVASASASTNNTVVSAPVTSESVPTARSLSSRLLLLAGLFFAGLVLLIISVGMYSKMRVRFSLVADNMPEHSL